MKNIYVVNESTLVTDTAAWNMAWVLDRQARYDLGKSGWRSDIRVGLLAKSTPIPNGGAVLHLLDTSDTPGALGYHSEDGNDVPFARVFVQTTIQNGGSPSEVASHEMAEMIGDEHVNLSALDGSGSKLYALELGDPVQGTGYTIAGVRVANFALPSYFDPGGKPPFDFEGVLKAPFTIAPQGYMSVLDLANYKAGWTQVLGSERTAPPSPELDDRLSQR